MSTILEALEKARRERGETQNTGYSILDTVPPPLPIQPTRRRTRIATIVLFTGITSLVLILILAGALVFFYQRFGTLAHQMAVNSTSNQSPMRTYVAGGGVVQSGGAAAVAGSPASPAREMELPPPVPIQEVLAAQREQVAPPPPGATVAILPDASALRQGVETQAAVEKPVAAPTATQGKVENEPSLDGFTLGAILYDPKVPMAVVNGMTVREGMVYDDFRVLRITPNSVVVQRAGRPPMTLRMQR